MIQQSTTRSLLSLFLVASLVACGPAVEVPVVAGSTPATEATSPAELATPTPALSTPTPEPTLVDVCALILPEEVQSILGQEVPGKFFGPYISCDYTVSSSQGMSISIGQGEDAKAAFVLIMADLVSVTGSDATSVQTLEQMKTSLPSLTLRQTFEMAFPLYESVGYTTTPQNGPGSAAYFMWWGQYNFGQVVAFRDDHTWLLIGARPLEEASAQATMTGLVTEVLGRLPEAFTISGEE